MPRFSSMNRRDFLSAAASAVALTASGSKGFASFQGQGQARPKIAAVVTEFTHRSHAHVIVENFLEPYYFNGQLTDPGMDLVSLYVDQSPEQRDMSRDVAKEYGFPIFPTIAEALTLGDKKGELAVDGVLSIGEHGRYPRNELGQMMYPRKRFFDEITDVYRQSGRVVPLYNDKHLTYRWDWAVEMMDTVDRLKIPFMAGSSVPLAQRIPPLELPENARIEEAVSIHGGNLEGYDFHALEVLQSMVEAREGGESGVSEVQILEGDDAWKAADEGRWSYELAEAAMNAGHDGPKINLREFGQPRRNRRGGGIHVILIKHRDGLRSTVLRIGASSTQWKFACRLKGDSEPKATSFYVGPWQNRNLFKALSHAIQTHIRQQQAPYPVERTFLVTGILAAAMKSRFEGHKPLETPELDIAYQPRDYRAMREMGESWKIITEDQEEPMGINPGGPRPEKKPSSGRSDKN